VVGGDEWLSTGEAARLMGVSRWKVIEMADAGELVSTRVPGSSHRRISRASAEANRLGGPAAADDVGGKPPPGP
jgi:excisionase family DNA binding protein